jgi:sugar phosphate isomerase/epimerase
LIVQVQLADTGRNHPGTGSNDYDTFVGNLNRSGYSGRVSVEIMHEIADIEKADPCGSGEATGRNRPRSLTSGQQEPSRPPR